MFSAVFSLFLDRFFQCPVKYLLWVLSMEIVLLIFFFIYIFIRKIAYKSIEQLISCADTGGFENEKEVDWHDRIILRSYRYSGNTPVATYPDATLLAAVTILPSADMSVASMVTLPITNIETVTIPTVNGTFNFTIVALLCPVTAETV
ncbi:uncharacterized protein N7503_011949 [Penicillium pulvis]|uniref:uncharacterized protein n=1 Tax=Penicillium pulvis TaxID=1562058 RepID=UPI0025489196|nr:uncharacterized protein N7503_011949 [Penicillium pulvis]KAJ5786737.1 hypothetical protein N7503_011949 [Penicillium pulvis]